MSMTCDLIVNSEEVDYFERGSPYYLYAIIKETLNHDFEENSRFLINQHICSYIIRELYSFFYHSEKSYFDKFNSEKDINGDIGITIDFMLKVSEYLKKSENEVVLFITQ